MTFRAGSPHYGVISVRSLPQDLIHGLSLGQFIHQLVHLTHLPHDRILDLLDTVAEDHLSNLFFTQSKYAPQAKRTNVTMGKMSNHE